MTPLPSPKTFFCEPADNGGWIMREQPAEQYQLGRTLGAFSGADDLLSYLHIYLKAAPKPEVEEDPTTRPMREDAYPRQIQKNKGRGQ
jgi:hypothetical protein